MSGSLWFSICSLAAPELCLVHSGLPCSAEAKQVELVPSTTTLTFNQSSSLLSASFVTILPKTACSLKDSSAAQSSESHCCGPGRVTQVVLSRGTGAAPPRSAWREQCTH